MTTPLEDALQAVEQHIEMVSAALLKADAPTLEQASTGLRDTAARFSYALDLSRQQVSIITPALKARMDAIAATLVVHRESLARLAAITDRQTAVLVPSQDSSANATYGNGLGGKQKAAGVAKIYRSAG
ncbi:hypothetical protein [Acidovorax sp. A1169]|uniref:hypothetical protein n=1 Tax=Acidovorax sp. A1169 TaxID=3059524 RepID=UPI002737D8CB|nr:hypothetical protein [Acidovorax sp. A1169]MDP4078077.1 hypothetical protein [Acidovorax sp. A1169]